jgi:hypothetical protein
MLGRSSPNYTAYERLVFGAAILLGLLAVRNWAFATLLLMMLAPSGFDRALRQRTAARPPVIGAAVGVAAAVAAIVGLVAAIAAPPSHLTRRYPEAAADRAAQAATRPGTTVYAGIPFADWLMWLHPELAGRLVFDVRYELLEASEVKRLVLFDAGSGVDRPLGAPSVYLLDPESEQNAVDALRSDVRIVYETDRAVVAVDRDAN